MKFMIHFVVTEEQGSKIEAAPGGPGPLLGYITERLKPDAVYMSPARREGWIVATLDEQKMAETMIFFSTRFGAYPTITPAVSIEEFPKFAGPAIEASAKAPRV